MISKNRIKFLLSLQKKKVREDERLYVIEGDKLVREYLEAGIRIKYLVAKPEFISSLSQAQKTVPEEIATASYDDLKSISTLKTPHNALAVVVMPDQQMNVQDILRQLSVALDFVQDPGNLGTIIRAAAWFGINNILCSTSCVDAYNPKVVQASMGAILNVKVHYCNLMDVLAEANRKKIPVYGTLLDGEPIYSSRLGRKGIILLGNESKGISTGLMPYVTRKLFIPKFTKEVTGIESLNVGMAASIVFSEFARRKKQENS
ncbi:MAG: RNA methyltransferase [Bacteroidota bacterium]|nr:RNA methyltransferase [Bacteroidota bacterium]